MVTQDLLKSILHYEPKTGLFTWKRSRGGAIAGSVAGTPRQNGYINIFINHTNNRAHRLAWLYMYGYIPDCDIDHINGIRDDNRISNLRLATRSQNNANSKVASHNTSGYKGVWFDKSRNKFVSQIKINGTNKHIGRFNTAEEAHAAYCEVASSLHGEFARFQ